MKYLFFSNDGKLGDAIVHTSFVQGVINNDDSAEIHCTAGGFNKFFWESDDRICKKWIIDKPSWYESIKIGIKLRKYKFDYLIIWNKIKSEKVKLIIFLAKPKKIIISPENNSKHISTRDNIALRKIFNSTTFESYKIQNSSIQKIEYEKYILINLFAGDIDYTRTISINNSRKIIEELLKISGEDLLIILNCHDNTENLAKKVGSIYPKNIKVINCSSDIRKLIGLVYYAKLIITVDSAIVHIASAFKKKIVAYYKNNNNEIIKWHPLGATGVTFLSRNSNLNDDFPDNSLKYLNHNLLQMKYHYNDGEEFSNLILSINSIQELQSYVCND